MTGLYGGYELTKKKDNTALLWCNLHTKFTHFKCKLNHLSKFTKLCSLHHNPILERVQHPKIIPLALLFFPFFPSFPSSLTPFFPSC